MESKVVWNGNMSFTGFSETGNSIPMDTSKAMGGSEHSFQPMQLFAIGLCSCTAMDVISILQKSARRLPASRSTPKLKGLKRHPKVFTKIHLEYKVTGKTWIQKRLNAVELSETRYCPSIAMLEKTAEISNTITIIEAED